METLIGRAPLTSTNTKPAPNSGQSEEFVEKFTSAKAGTDQEAAIAHDTLLNLYNSANNISRVTASLPYLVSLAEMSEPPV